MRDDINPAVVDRVLRELIEYFQRFTLASDASQVQSDLSSIYVGTTPAERRAADHLYVEHIGFVSDRSIRVFRVLEIATPHMAAGAGTWEEIETRLSPEERERWDEAWADVYPGDFRGRPGGS